MELDPILKNGLKLLHSNDNTSAEKLRLAIDEIIGQKYGPSKLLSSILSKKYLNEEANAVGSNLVAVKRPKIVEKKREIEEPVESVEDEHLKELEDLFCKNCKRMDVSTLFLCFKSIFNQRHSFFRSVPAIVLSSAPIVILCTIKNVISHPSANQMPMIKRTPGIVAHAKKRPYQKRLQQILRLPNRVAVVAAPTQKITNLRRAAVKRVKTRLEMWPHLQSQHQQQLQLLYRLPVLMVVAHQASIL